MYVVYRLEGPLWKNIFPRSQKQSKTEDLGKILFHNGQIKVSVNTKPILTKSCCLCYSEIWLHWKQTNGPLRALGPSLETSNFILSPKVMTRSFDTLNAKSHLLYHQFLRKLVPACMWHYEKRKQIGVKMCWCVVGKEINWFWIIFRNKKYKCIEDCVQQQKLQFKIWGRNIWIWF